VAAESNDTVWGGKITPYPEPYADFATEGNHVIVHPQNSVHYAISALLSSVPFPIDACTRMRARPPWLQASRHFMDRPRSYGNQCTRQISHPLRCLIPEWRRFSSMMPPDQSAVYRCQTTEQRVSSSLVAARSVRRRQRTTPDGKKLVDRVMVESSCCAGRGAPSSTLEPLVAR
jgi:hypothetical protein